MLEKEGIHCNLTLLFGMHQAIACAEAKAHAHLAVRGRILDWYKKDDRQDASYAAARGPGRRCRSRASTTTSSSYGHKTEVMGASFRNLGEITELAGCDLLTIAPNLLDRALRQAGGRSPRKLDPKASAAHGDDRIAMDEATFRTMHDADRMAKDKLEEGIAGFSKALVALEKQLAERLDVLAGELRAGDAARDLFKRLRPRRRRLHHARRVGRSRRRVRRARRRPRRAHHARGDGRRARRRHFG